MAAVRSRAQLPVGSAQWINDENDQVTQFCDQEIEDFTFSARNEVEWLNEHMAEIFSKNQVNVTEIFKTPGKLRGKTPRTARKRNPLEAREVSRQILEVGSVLMSSQPLTDIFSVNARTNGSPLQRASPFKPAPSFQVAEDPVAHIVAKKPTKENTDSGYRDVSEDENVDIHQVPAVVQSSAESHEEFPPLSYGEEPNMTSQSGDHSTTEPSFHSAKEEITKRDVTKVSPKKEAELNGDVESRAEPTKDDAEVQVTSMPEQLHEDAMGMDVEDKDLDEDLIVDESRSPSQGSSPARPLVRKSSLTFAALPAREPLTTKKSIGSSVSRTSHLDQSKGPASRGSFLGRFTGGKSLGGYKQPESAPEVEKDDEMDVAMDRPALAHEESEDSKMTKLHNKSSTQRLHERINMLGKSQPARPTKSIPAAAATNLSYPELPIAEPQPQNLQQTASMALKSVTTQSNEEDDDDWIQSPQPLPNASSRPQLSKSLSVDVMEDIREKQSTRSQEFDLDQNDREATREPSPLHQTQGHQLNRLDITRAASTIESEALRKAQAAANVKSTHGTASPALARAHEAATSTTPVGSPSSKRYVDGPLSASKSKLQFIMKTARGLFSSSAGVSTQAKMETLSPPSMRTNGEPRARSIDDALQSKSAEGRKSNSPASHVIGRRTRSSTEKEERRKEVEAKERQRAEVEPERHREQVSVKAGPHKPAQTSAPAKPTRQSPRKAPNQEASKEHADVAETDVPPQSMGPPPPHAQGQPPQTQRLKDVRRPIKPGKETALKPKPQPVAIRVGTLSQGLRMNNAALSSSLQDSLPPQPKQPIVTKKPSNASLHSAASSGSFKSSVNPAATKPKALIAAERKKGQVSYQRSWLKGHKYSSIFRMRRKPSVSWIRSARSNANELLSKKRPDVKSNYSVKKPSANVSGNVLLRPKIPRILRSGKPLRREG